MRTEILLPRLQPITDVEFLVVKQDIPALMYVKDMLENRIDISVGKRCTYHNGRAGPLFLENYSLVHKGTPEDEPF